MTMEITSGFYMPSDKVVRHYDVGDFQEAAERASTTTDEEEEEHLLRRAIDFYKAPFLETIDMPWVNERRTHLQQLYSQSLISLGHICRRKNDQHEALGYYTRALKESPAREDIHREVMRLYIGMGANEDARKQFHYLEQVLEEYLGVAPSDETRQLYESIGA